MSTPQALNALVKYTTINFEASKESCSLLLCWLEEADEIDAGLNFIKLPSKQRQTLKDAGEKFFDLNWVDEIEPEIQIRRSDPVIEGLAIENRKGDEKLWPIDTILMGQDSTANQSSVANENSIRH